MSASDLQSYVRAAADAAGVPVEMITGRCRFVAAERMHAMAEAYRAGHSAQKIGYAFQRDRTTVMHAYRRRYG